MAYSIIQAVKGPDGTGATGNLTLSIAAVGSGNAIMGFVMYANGDPVAPTVVAGSNTLTVVNHLFDANNTNGVAMFYGMNITGGPTSIVASWASGVISFTRALMLEVSGVGSFDKSAAFATIAAASGSTVSSGNTATLAGTGELLYGCCANTQGGVQTAYTQGSGYAIQNNAGGAGNTACAMADETQTDAASAAIAATMSVATAAASNYYTGIMAFTAASVANLVAWGFEEEPKRLVRRPVKLFQTQPDEFIRNPTQVVFKPWGFEEEPQHHGRMRPRWHAPPEPIREEFLKNPTQFPAPAWVQDPDYFPRRSRVWRSHPEPLREEFLRNPTQTVFANWAFDEPRWRGSPRPLRQPANPQASDDMAPPAAAAVTVPYSDDETHRPTRRVPWSPLLRTDAIEGLPFTAATPTNWPDAEQTTRVWRRSVLARAAQDEFLFNPTQISFAAWGFDEENHRQERRVLPRLTPQDDPIGLPQLVGVPWAFEEEAHRIERRTFHRLVQQDDPLGLTQLVGVAWGFEEEPQHAVPRRRSWRSYAEPLREEFLRNPTQTAFVGWGFEEELHRLQRRPFHRLTQQDDPLGAVQLVGVPWAFEEEAHRTERRIFRRLVQQEDPIGLVQLVGVAWGFEEEAHGLKYRPGWHAHPAPADNEGLPFTAVVTSTKWADIEQYISPRRWRARLARIAPDEFLPLSAQQAALVNWAFEEESHRMWRRPGWRAAPLPDEFLRNATQTVFAAWGFEEEAHRLQRRPFHRLTQQDDPLGVVQLVGIPWAFEEEAHRQQRGIFHRLVQQDDPLGPVQLVSAAWGFDVEDPRPVRRGQLSARALLEDWVAVPPLVTLWGWETDQNRGQRKIWRPQLAAEEFFAAAGPFAWSDIEQANARRLPQLVRVRPDDFLIQIPRAISSAWGFEEEWRGFRLWVPWRARPQPDEFLIRYRSPLRGRARLIDAAFFAALTADLGEFSASALAAAPADAELWRAEPQDALLQ